MSSIRIIATPAGEAPESVRQAWIGLVLPLRDDLNRPILHTPVGVLTGAEAKGGCSYLFKNLFMGNTKKKRESYLVNAKAAVDFLAHHNPEAAQWWFEHTPHLFTSPKRMLAFEREVCEFIP